MNNPYKSQMTEEASHTTTPTLHTANPIIIENQSSLGVGIWDF